MHIGLIGGIGPAATDFYYRALIQKFKQSGNDLEASIVHADAQTLLSNMAQSREADQVAIYSRLTDRLKNAGAECVIVTSIAGHFCIDAFKQVSPLPVIDMLEEVDRAVSKLGLKRLGILGTETVMASRFYNAVKDAEVIPPGGPMLEQVHHAYVDMATSGIATQDHQNIFDTAGTTLISEQGADAIMLGGTDLALVYNEGHSPFPVLDCAAVHVDAIFERAVG